MLHLPDVTLVMIDTHCAELARLAIEDTLKLVRPAELLVFSPLPLIKPINLRVTWHAIPQWDNAQFTRFVWNELPCHIHTSHLLFIQWDAWVLDPAMWTNQFLDYDYIGAPWSYADGLNVGNGCGLRSARLMKFLAAQAQEFPVPGDKEDDVLCRTYRPGLERRGFRWPSEQAAARFAFEGVRPAKDSHHFMFHDSFNFPVVLDGEHYGKRLWLMQHNEHLRARGKIERLFQGGASVLPRLAMEKAA